MKKEVRQCLAALTMAIVQGAMAADVQDIAGGRFLRVLQAKAYYEINQDGVPLLGLITGELTGNRVRFTTCSDVTVEVERERLRISKATCPLKIKDYGPWVVEGRGIVPVMKAAASSPTVVKFEGKAVDLRGWTYVKDPIASAKVGDLVGYAFTDDNGKKSLIVLDTKEK